MYKRVSDLRPLDFIILTLIALAILFQAITYWELDQLRNAVQRIEIEEGH